jgi:hypothetical protein
VWQGLLMSTLHTAMNKAWWQGWLMTPLHMAMESW